MFCKCFLLLTARLILKKLKPETELRKSTSNNNNKKKKKKKNSSSKQRHKDQLYQSKNI